MRKTYFIALILLIVVLCSCQEPIQEPNNNWQDESILGEKIVNEELNEFLKTVGFGFFGESSLESILVLPDFVFSTKRGKIFEMNAVRYGDYICGYLEEETIAEVEKNVKLATPPDEMLYSDGIDKTFTNFLVLNLKKVIIDKELFVYRNKEDNPIYQINDKRLVAVWRELILEGSDGRQITIICGTNGELNGNNYFVNETLSSSGMNGDKLELNDKVWIFESYIKNMFHYKMYVWSMMEIKKYNDDYALYDECYTNESVLEVDNEDVRNSYINYLNWVEEFVINKEVIYCDQNNNAIWCGYWLNYSKVKEALNIE